MNTNTTEFKIKLIECLRIKFYINNPEKFVEEFLKNNNLVLTGDSVLLPFCSSNEDKKNIMILHLTI